MLIELRPVWKKAQTISAPQSKLTALNLKVPISAPHPVIPTPSHSITGIVMVTYKLPLISVELNVKKQGYGASPPSYRDGWLLQKWCTTECKYSLIWILMLENISGWFQVCSHGNNHFQIFKEISIFNKLCMEAGSLWRWRWRSVMWGGTGCGAAGVRRPVSVRALSECCCGFLSRHWPLIIFHCWLTTARDTRLSNWKLIAFITSKLILSVSRNLRSRLPTNLFFKQDKLPCHLL